MATTSNPQLQSKHINFNWKTKQTYEIVFFLNLKKNVAFVVWKLQETMLTSFDTLFIW